MVFNRDYQAYEEACKRIRAANGELLDEFADWLRRSGLSDKTGRKHVSNIDLYVNHFLLYEDALEPPAGVYQVGMFLGYWFIRKAAWASPASVRGNGASLKKFCKYLHERSEVSAEALDHLRTTIKSGMPDWLRKAARYG